MDFYQKYELLDLLKDEGVKVFNAREIATGRRITMFLFVGEQARLHADLLEQLRTSQRQDLLEVGDNQGTPYVATEPLGGLADLKQEVAAAPAPLSTPPPAPSAGKPPDAFTRVGVWHIPAPTLSSARGAAPVTPVPPTAAAPPPQSAPGEFTRMFQASAAPQPMGEAAPPAAPPAPPKQAAPGEFTQMFQAAAPAQPMGEAAPPAARPPAPPKQAAPGEFTRMFQTPAAPQPMGEVAPPVARPPVPPAQPVLGGQVGDLPHGGGSPVAGEFTRFFQSPLSQQAPAHEPVFPPPSAAPPPPPVSSAPGEFTRIFGRADMPMAQPAPPRPEFTPPAPPAPSTGPGEYTRMFSAQPVVQPQPAAAAPAPAPAAAPIAARKVPWLMVALIVAVVVLLAVVVIMTFALRK